MDNNTEKNIRAELLSSLIERSEEAYADFSAKLTPTVPRERILGVRLPALRELAKRHAEDKRIGEFLSSLPHEYLEENTLHALIINEARSLEDAIGLLDAFLPFVDNWATSDSLRPAAIKKHFPAALPHIRRYIESGHTYTARFGIEMLMLHGLDGDFSPEFHERVANKRGEDYYLNMMRAWYFATALAKRFDETLPYLIKGRLDEWTHNKAIQKAIESRRLSAEQKKELRALKHAKGRGAADERIVEVAAAVIREGERVLICKRGEGRARADLWEFPGGKLEKGESAEQAAVRECREELNIVLEPARILGDFVHRYSDITIRLYAVEAVIKEGNPKPAEHSEIRFVLPSELNLFALSGADAYIAELLQGEKRQGF